jgi:tetratricopeptide (TPR) repeat protein
VRIEGQPLAAGKYGFFIAYDPNECTLIFSKNSTSWGSYYYNPNDDVLKVRVKPIATDKSVEWLNYEFINETKGSAVVELQWEKLVIPFKIDVDVINTQIESFRKELHGEMGVTWLGWKQAALFCAQNKVDLDEALQWANNATSVDFGGSQSFTAWTTKAAVLDSLGRGTEAAEVLKRALPLGSVSDLYNYARNLVWHKKTKEAFEIAKMNYDKYPDQYLSNTGLARAYSAIGDYKKALTFAQKADAQAPDKDNKDWMDKIIKTLLDNKDFNEWT